MSTNAVYDAILDEVIRIHEEDDDRASVWLPEAFTVNLEPDQLEALLKAGLVSGGQPIPITVGAVLVQVLNHNITFRREPDANAVQAETVH